MKGLLAYNTLVDVYDPWVDLKEAKAEYGLNCLSSMPENNAYSAVILAVGHDQFKAMGIDGIKAFAVENAVIFDVKSVLDKASVDGRL